MPKKVDPFVALAWQAAALGAEAARGQTGGSGSGHDPVTVTDSTEIDFTLVGQDITASLIAGSIDETKLDTSVNASLDLADSAVQSGDLAAVAFSGDYGDLINTPSLATVATSGDYDDLINTPSLATVATTGAYSDLSGLPTLGTISSQDASSVTVSGGTINGTTVGASTPAAGTFTTLTTTGAFTSLGIDDNATGERLQLADTVMTMGTTNALYTIGKVDDLHGISLAGGTANDQGSSITVFGDTQATNANDVLIRSANDFIYWWDDSLDEHLWYAPAAAFGSPRLSLTSARLTPSSNDGLALGTSSLGWSDLYLASGAVVGFNSGAYTITHSSGLLTASAAVTVNGALTTNGAFTSLGIDDNATGERFQLSDTDLVLGTTGTASFQINKADNSSNFHITGGTAFNSSAALTLFGNSHSTNANDIFLRSGANEFVYHLDYSEQKHRWYANTGTERMALTSAGLLMNQATNPASMVGGIAIANGTAPSSSPANQIQMWAEDISSSSELRVRDEAGNTTTLSPHNFEGIPDGASEEQAWSYFSERDGNYIAVDITKALRILEQLSGQKLIYQGTVQIQEGPPEEGSDIPTVIRIVTPFPEQEETPKEKVPDGHPTLRNN